ncbi:MAG: hypothetical protein JXR91_17580 [Deltaproteobacteria bacterium]|nr:hypothetical protein [Deltaproteobacteria bacterium]
MVTKMVVKRQKSSGKVCAAASSYEDNIITATTSAFGEAAGAASGVLLKAAKDSLTDATDNMFKADQAHLMELSDDTKLIELRDGSIDKVRGT